MYKCGVKLMSIKFYYLASYYEKSTIMLNIVGNDMKNHGFWMYI